MLKIFLYVETRIRIIFLGPITQIWRFFIYTYVRKSGPPDERRHEMRQNEFLFQKLSISDLRSCADSVKIKSFLKDNNKA